MRAARVEVIGPNKRTAPLESGTGPQNYCKLMTETIFVAAILFFSLKQLMKVNILTVKFIILAELSDSELLQLSVYPESTERRSTLLTNKVENEMKMVK